MADPLAALARITDAIQEGQEKGLDRAAQVTLEAKQREIRKTYSRAIPRNGRGNLKWDRSGDWHDEQRIQSEPGVRRVGPEGNSEAYEERLASLPDGPDGINRSNPAMQKAIDVIEPQLIAIVEQEIQNALDDLANS